MAASEAIGLKAVWHILPLFVGAAAALFLDPPKSRWAVPVLLLVFMGFGEVAGPILAAKVEFFAGADAFARFTAAALGWTVLKLAQRTIRKIDLAGMLPGSALRNDARNNEKGAGRAAD